MRSVRQNNESLHIKSSCSPNLLTFSLISDRAFRAHGSIFVAVDDFSSSGEKSTAQSRESEVRKPEIEKRWHE